MGLDVLIVRMTVLVATYKKHNHLLVIVEFRQHVERMDVRFQNFQIFMDVSLLVNYLWILHTDLSVCNYIQILHTDFTYR